MAKKTVVNSSSGDSIAHLDVFLGRSNMWSYLKVEVSSFLLESKVLSLMVKTNYQCKRTLKLEGKT